MSQRRLKAIIVGSVLLLAALGGLVGILHRSSIATQLANQAVALAYNNVR